MSGQITSISDVIADQIRALRKRKGLSREEIAAAARDAGAPESFTATALGNIETGRRDAQGRRRRDVSVDELLWLAAAAELPPLALLGEAAAPFGASTVDCPRCAGERGQVEVQVRREIAELGELGTLQGSHAELAYMLARRIDAALEERAVPALAKELRATLALLAAEREPPSVDEPPADIDDDLSEPE